MLNTLRPTELYKECKQGYFFFRKPLIFLINNNCIYFVININIGGNVEKNIICNVNDTKSFCFRRESLASFHDMKHAVTSLFVDEATSLMCTAGKDRVLKVGWRRY